MSCDKARSSDALTPQQHIRHAVHSLANHPTCLCNVTAPRRVDPNRKKSSGSELAGALDSNPDIYVPEIADSGHGDFVAGAHLRLEKMEISATHEALRAWQGSSASSCVCTSFTLGTHPSHSSHLAAASGLRLRTSRWWQSTETKNLNIDVKPACMTLRTSTAASRPTRILPLGLAGKGTMERRNGLPTPITVHVDLQGASGEIVGHLCFISRGEGPARAPPICIRGVQRSVVIARALLD